jgi:hypothetical protein
MNGQTMLRFAQRRVVIEHAVDVRFQCLDRRMRAGDLQAVVVEHTPDLGGGLEVAVAREFHSRVPDAGDLRDRLHEVGFREVSQRVKLHGDGQVGHGCVCSG